MIQTAWYHCIRAPSVPTESCTAERESATPADGGILRLPDPVPVVFVEARDWLRGLLSGEPK